MIEIVGAEQLDRLEQLQPVAEAIFGRKQRTPDWLRRKLERERVVPELSAIAREREGGAVVGYALLGRPASLEGRARGAGVGVLASARGRGIGRDLIELVCARAEAAGCTGVEFLVEPARVEWYAAQGFAVIEEQLTMASEGLAGSPAPIECGATLASAPFGARAWWSWTPEAWAHTPAQERAYLQLQAGRAWLTREGRAYLVQRIETLDPTNATLLEPSLMALRERIGLGVPVLAYPCSAAGDVFAAVRRAGFEVVQRSFVLRRDDWCIVASCD